MGPSDSVSSVTVSNEILRVSKHFKDTGLRGNNSEKQAGSGLTSLKALVANVRSLRQACGELAATAHDTSAHVICVTETFLDGDAIKPLTPDGYICAGRRDRIKHGGGVLVFLRDSVLYSAYDTSTQYHIQETAEMVAVRIEELGVVIITVYAQPSEKNTDLIIALGKLQAKIEADGLKSVICGDFNAHNKEFLGSLTSTWMAGNSMWNEMSTYGWDLSSERSAWRLQTSQPCNGCK